MPRKDSCLEIITGARSGSDQDLQRLTLIEGLRLGKD